MKIQILATLETTERYTNKMGEEGCNIVLSSLDTETKKRSFLNFNCKNINHISTLEGLLQEEIVLVIELNQNNFGLRLGEIISVKKANQLKSSVNQKIAN